MRYWWVNQNQTFRHEIEGGYLWSPKRNKNGHRNPFYEFMREVAPGDIVFSFCDTRIAALGIVSGYCRESPKPEEFGTAGTNWSQIGWRVGVRWQRLSNSIRPKDHIARLRPDLASKYAPLTPDGNGLQSVYLTEISRGLAAALFTLIGAEAYRVAKRASARMVRAEAGLTWGEFDAATQEHGLVCPGGRVTTTGIAGECELSRGDSALLACICVDNEPIPLPTRPEVEGRVDGTVETWRRWVEGIEFNFLGLVAGIDLRHPGVKLPGFGRLGIDDGSAIAAPAPVTAK